jgi:hypothetical protein
MSSPESNYPKQDENVRKRISTTPPPKPGELSKNITIMRLRISNIFQQAKNNNKAA